jgi:hypothetical protein
LWCDGIYLADSSAAIKPQLGYTLVTFELLYAWKYALQALRCFTLTTFWLGAPVTGPGSNSSHQNNRALQLHTAPNLSLHKPAKLMLQLALLLLLLVIFSQFDDEFVAKNYPTFESAADLRQSLVSSTSLARMKDVEARIQDAIVTQVSCDCYITHNVTNLMTMGI